MPKSNPKPAEKVEQSPLSGKEKYERWRAELDARLKPAEQVPQKSESETTGEA